MSLNLVVFCDQILKYTNYLDYICWLSLSRTNRKLGVIYGETINPRLHNELMKAFVADTGIDPATYEQLFSENYWISGEYLLNFLLRSQRNSLDIVAQDDSGVVRNIQLGILLCEKINSKSTVRYNPLYTVNKFEHNIVDRRFPVQYIQYRHMNKHKFLDLYCLEIFRIAFDGKRLYIQQPDVLFTRKTIITENLFKRYCLSRGLRPDSGNHEMINSILVYYQYLGFEFIKS